LLAGKKGPQELEVSSGTGPFCLSGEGGEKQSDRILLLEAEGVGEDGVLIARMWEGELGKQKKVSGLVLD